MFYFVYYYGVYSVLGKVLFLLVKVFFYFFKYFVYLGGVFGKYVGSLSVDIFIGDWYCLYMKGVEFVFDLLVVFLMFGGGVMCRVCLVILSLVLFVSNL